MNEKAEIEVDAVRFGRAYRLLFALIAGLAVALLPMATVNFPESGILGGAGLAIRFLMLPGVIVSMIALQNVHAISIRAVDVIDVVFYVALFYILLHAWARRKAGH